MLIFGDGRAEFNNEWRQQGLVYNNNVNLKYGLIQHKVIRKAHTHTADVFLGWALWCAGLCSGVHY